MSLVAQTSRDRQSLAYHEAGHITMRLLFGIPVDHASIEDDPARGVRPQTYGEGSVTAAVSVWRAGGRPQPAPRAVCIRLVHLALTFLAGDCAQRKLDSPRYTADSAKDRTDAIELLKELKPHATGNAVIERTATLQEKACRILDHRDLSGSVQRFANALFERTTLNREEIAEIWG